MGCAVCRASGPTAAGRISGKNPCDDKFGPLSLTAGLPPKNATAYYGEVSAATGRRDVNSSRPSTATEVSPALNTTDSPFGTTARTAATGGSNGDEGCSVSRIRKDVDISEFYEIAPESCLGTGISGAVRLGRHRQTNKKYAIKTLALKDVGLKKAAMLRNEVMIYLKLDHPNIAKLVEVYETAEAIRLVMELCTGGELYDRLAKRKKYSEFDAAAVTRQMLEAIHYCHKHHICHRDLKLENWVYADEADDAKLKLIDFGFSRIFHPGIPMTAMHGTVYYVSPEVMEGCYEEKCDVWSIGVIVFMLLSGAPPFNGTHDHQILLKIKRGQYSFSGPRWIGISDLAKQFISKLLERDANLRPSAEEALQHPWLALKPGRETREISHEVVTSMRNFALAPNYTTTYAEAAAADQVATSRENVFDSIMGR